MQTEIQLPRGLSLQFSNGLPDGQRYATRRLQRGLLLLDGDEPLAEEGVGFGVPLLKRGLQTIFPGSAQVDWQQDGARPILHAGFKLNLVERLGRSKDRTLNMPLFYGVKDLLAAAIRRMPATRRSLTGASSRLRRIFGWETAYVEGGFEDEVSVTYRVDPAAGRLRVEIDCRGLDGAVTEVVLMHEQGAHAFDRYRDSSGLRLEGERIGCWDEVRAAEARFESSSRKVAFELAPAAGARLFRGRELIGSRLAWAGFGYSFPPALGGIQHEIVISRLP